MSEVRLEGAQRLRGRVRVPGDKSGSHRALMLGALASGSSTVTGLSGGEDVAATARIVSQLGAEVLLENERVIVRGPLKGLRASDDALDCGNSGTSMRLFAGIVAGIEGRHQLVGDASLSRRPMDRVARPLRLMGAEVEGHGDALTPPLRISGAAPLHAIDYDVPVVSAQVKSAILFAGLAADGPTTVREATRTRSTTEDMLLEAGVLLRVTNVREGREVTIEPGRPEARTWRVPGDPSQAAFFAVLGVVHRDAQINIAPIDRTPERVGFVDVLRRMGANLAWGDDGSLRAETSPLLATEIWAAEIPSVDEVPALTVAAAAAHGVTAFRNMGELRVKESDRFAGSLALARALGCATWSEGDDFYVRGLEDSAAFADLHVEVELDHRMVMAAAVAALAGHGGTILGATSVSSSYPTFFEHLASLQ